MKKILVFIVFIALVGVLYHFSLNKKEKPIKSVQIGETLITNVEIADTAEKKELGLSGRESIPDNFVMIFPFDTPGYYEFWMKDMNFPIDIIWTDENGVVTGLVKDAKPESYPESFKPEKPSNYVLETHAGLAEKEGLKVGDQIIFGR